jgi:hypothetical protein
VVLRDLEGPEVHSFDEAQDEGADLPDLAASRSDRGLLRLRCRALRTFGALWAIVTLATIVALTATAAVSATTTISATAAIPTTTTISSAAAISAAAPGALSSPPRPIAGRPLAAFGTLGWSRLALGASDPRHDQRAAAQAVDVTGRKIRDLQGVLLDAEELAGLCNHIVAPLAKKLVGLTVHVVHR